MSMVCETVIFVFRGVLSGLMCLVGLCGNALSVAVLLKIGGTSVTYFLLRAMAMVDTVYLVAYIPSSVIPEFFYFYGADIKLLNWYQYMIWGLFPVASMSLTATVWVTTLVTVHRYLAICRPTETYTLSTMQGAMLQVGMVLVCSILVDLPKFFEQKVVTILVPDNTYIQAINDTNIQASNDINIQASNETYIQASNETYIQASNATYIVIKHTHLWEDKMYQLVYKNIAMIGIRKVLPIVITFVLTVLLVRQLIKRRRRHEQSKQLSYVLISIASVLIICQTPMAIYPLFRLFFDVPSNSCNHFYMYFSNIADWLGVVNSATNFFIYYPAVPTFRQQLVTMFSCLGPSDRSTEHTELLKNYGPAQRRDQPEDTVAQV